jgi:hypothetical protein
MHRQEQEILLHKISKRLMLSADFSDTLGLEKGKSGTIIFFYNYSRFTGLSIYEDFANELLDEMQNSIKNYNFDFRKTICGIGLCFEYLVHNQFIEADNDVMEEFDVHIKNYIDVKNKGIDNGLRGAAYYVISRYMTGNRLLDSGFIYNLRKSLLAFKENDVEIEFLLKQLQSIIVNNKIIEYPDILHLLLKNVTYTEDSFQIPLVYDMENGLTGIGLKIMQDITNNRQL